jgi:hypothetical protein
MLATWPDRIFMDASFQVRALTAKVRFGVRPGKPYRGSSVTLGIYATLGGCGRINLSE